jgi:catechol 2,3-dioxygenase-like lactoylglutathione lyase family enzyme
VPFVHVRDIARSLTFYEQLGFHVTARHPTTTPDPTWVSLEAGGANLMLQQTDDPADADAQGVLFYLFTRDLWGLRDRLIAAGIDAGEIRDGRPGPNAEMHLTDPDGYVLMVAQINEADDARGD